MARGKHRELKKTKIEIIPMIDTMFFLLVFFILSSLGIVKLQGIKIDLPTAQSTNTPPGPPPIEMIVVIGADKSITVNGIPVKGAHPNIGPILQREILKGLGPNPDMNRADVVVSADPTAPHGMVVTCIDQARQVNIKNFAIATSTATDTAGAAVSTAPSNAPPPVATKP